MAVQGRPDERYTTSTLRLSSKKNNPNEDEFCRYASLKRLRESGHSLGVKQLRAHLEKSIVECSTKEEAE